VTYNEVEGVGGNKQLIPEGSPVAQMADDLANKRLLLDMAKETAEALQKDYDKAEAALFDALEAAGLRAIRTPRGMFSLNDLAWARIEDPAIAREWAEANLPEAITLNHTRLSVIVRQALKGEATMPPGITWTTSRKITWRRQ
jgi:hypothetical protein